jgi:hypothetical protein
MQKTKGLSQCKTDWDFKPLDLWPSVLPLYCFQDQLLCGFERASREIQEDSNSVLELEGPLEEIIKALYPQLTLPELARLTEKMGSQDLRFLSHLFRIYGYTYTQELQENLKTLLTLSLEHQNWLSEKDISPRDLERMIPLEQTTVRFSQSLQFCIQNRFNKNQCLQACEWIHELSAMGHTEDSLFLPPMPAEQFLRQLKSLRYPQSTYIDASQNRQLQNLAWPNKTEARWTRQGDMAGVEIQLRAHTELEIEKQISTLVGLKDQIRKIWKAHSHEQ